MTTDMQTSYLGRDRANDLPGRQDGAFRAILTCVSRFTLQIGEIQTRTETNEHPNLLLK